MGECCGESEAVVLKDSEQLEVVSKIWRGSDQHVLFCVHVSDHFEIVVEGGSCFEGPIASTWDFGVNVEESNRC